MSYYTYFKGELSIELPGEHIEYLKTTFNNIFNEKVPSVLNEDVLKVDNEWGNRYDSLEKVILYIQKHGKLISGSIRCFGEDSKDVWEISILNGTAYIKEIGSYMTLNRSTRMQTFLNETGSIESYVQTYEIQ